MGWLSEDVLAVVSVLSPKTLVVVEQLISWFEELDGKAVQELERPRTCE
jgi:hypothetical protein